MRRHPATGPRSTAPAEPSLSAPVARPATLSRSGGPGRAGLTLGAGRCRSGGLARGAALPRWFAVAVLVVLATGCSTAPAGPAAPTAAPTPHAATAMVCQDEAEEDITAALGLPPSQPPTSTWADRRFTCTYRYGTAPLVVSVQELDDAGAARAYFDQQRTAAVSPLSFPDLGDAAFISNGVATVVLEDDVVLRVDVHGLPDTLGPKATPRNGVGITVATTILGCWTGS